MDAFCVYILASSYPATKLFAYHKTFPTFAIAYKILILLSIFSAGKVYFPRKNR